ncbi:MAG: CRTAC1 family protein, partial [Polyangia bacterium]
GRLDLWVTDDLAGLPFTTEETALKGYPAARNIGRDEKTRAITIRLPQFLRNPLVDGRNVKVDYAGKKEWEGRDSLFLNMGDTDGDGIPEWKDVTEEAGIAAESRGASFSVAVADVDLDGDLDVLVTNYQDPDFYGFGMRRFGGNQNELWLNQLAETGKLTFKNAAQAWGVSGLIAKDGRKASMYFPSEKREEPIAAQTVDGKPAGEVADHSWSSIFTDENLDGYPDLIVSTDEGDRLRVYTNDHGKRFVRDPRFDADQWDGCWMGAAAGDLDGDGREEVFVSNCGGQSMSAGNLGLLNKSAADESILALAPLDYALGKARLAHALLEPTPSGYVNIADAITVNHSPYIAPDLTRRENFAPSAIALYDQHNYAHGLSAYEFAYAAQMFDVDDDGDLDLYFAGALARGNDGFIGDWTSSPGRLLVNDTQAPGHIVLTDRTLAYRVLDMTDMDYAHNPPRRKSPGTNWHKRDFVNVQDMDSYAEAGLAASQHSLIHDLFFMHEAANGIATGDLNGDGYDDFVVTHFGGYNSLSPQAGNLKADVGGIILAIPAPNKVMKPPTNFDEGKTFVYINQNAGKLKNHFIKVRLTDEKSLNTRAIGARLVANGKIARTVRAGGCAGSASSTDVIVGLGPSGALDELEVWWPRKDRTPQTFTFSHLRDQLVCIDRSAGVIGCR